MTVTDGGLENLLEYREIIAHIAGSKLIFLVWVQNKNAQVHIFSPGACVYDCERYKMVSESSSYQEIHCEFCSIRSLKAYGCRK